MLVQKEQKLSTFTCFKAHSLSFTIIVFIIIIIMFFLWDLLCISCSELSCFLFSGILKESSSFTRCTDASILPCSALSAPNTSGPGLGATNTPLASVWAWLGVCYFP
jgi:hypothetical protein